MTDSNRLKFMTVLAKLTQPDNAEEAAGALVAMLPMLTHIPERAFASKDCLSRVATGKRRTVVPSYADIEAALNGWLRENSGDFPPSIGRDKFGLEGEDLQWFNYFYEREAEGFKPVKSGSFFGREHVLSLIKSRSVRAWGSITGESTEHPGEPTEEEKANVSATVQRIKDMLRAPRMPSASSVDAQMAAIRTGKPPPVEFGVVPAQRLAALRDANPAVQRARSFQTETPASADETFR